MTIYTEQINFTLAFDDQIGYKDTLFLKKNHQLQITLNTNEQDTIGSMVTDPVVCVVSILPKYQHVVSSLGSEENKQ